MIQDTATTQEIVLLKACLQGLRYNNDTTSCSSESKQSCLRDLRFTNNTKSCSSESMIQDTPTAQQIVLLKTGCCSSESRMQECLHDLRYSNNTKKKASMFA